MDDVEKNIFLNIKSFFKEFRHLQFGNIEKKSDK